LIVGMIIAGFVGTFSLITWNLGTCASDKAFILIEEKISNNKTHKLITFKFHITGLGYSRIYWAIIPANYIVYERLDLSDYLLPEGYMGIGWSKDNELVIEEWRPYYYMGRNRNLKNGDIFKGVKIKLYQKR